VANPQMMEQFNTIEPNTNEEEHSKDIEEDSKDSRQQFDTLETETIINVEEYYK